MKRHFSLACLTALLIIISPSTFARDYLKTDETQKFGISPGVVTEGGKTVWISGQDGLYNEQGKSMAGDFEGQARVIFRSIDAIAKRAGEALRTSLILRYT
ncbi:hypothetical protein NAL19_3186 [Pectobacterium sp. F1-1]|uniref:RidA family protein n=1 Tax=Pectobacterium sp. F1-1 TaxID=2949614 RepID=UPI0021D7BDA0|nr:hypothetical protein [Pectobacterium sp. F1-1]UYA61265.1 hypothetical protein NAL19_3186 [Pectobacterium sp. F1-1]